MKSLLVSLVLSIILSLSVRAQSLTVSMTGIENSNGQIRLALFSTDKEYESERPKIAKIVSKKNMKNGCLTVTFTDIPAGKYGIALLDDENCNGKMDYYLLVPTEGFGFSNYPSSGLSKPEFNKFCFSFGQENKTISIKVRYI